MAPKTEPAKRGAEILVLPSTIVSRVDVTRLAREVESMVGYLEQKSHNPDSKLMQPPTTDSLKAMVRANDLDMAETKDRQRLYSFLTALKTDAPRIHMSFAVEAPVDFTAKLVDWLRSEIHPLILLDIGLQPSIAAGCIIRTTNKIIDCSMRQHLQAKRPDLLKRLHATEASHA